LEAIFNFCIHFAIRITQEVIKRAIIIVWNTKEDPGNPIGHVGVLEPFLYHHVILLDKSGADK
jgi:hypothetical protein